MRKYLLTLSFILVAVFTVAYFMYSVDKPIITSETDTSEGILDFPSAKKNFIKHKADKPGEFFKYFEAISNRPGGQFADYPANYRFKEFNKAKSNQAVARSSAALDITAVTSRGPGNVGGRTRALIVDPTDPTHQTWYAGAASGGIWMTTDAGGSWTNLSPDLPNLSVNSLDMALQGGQKIIYAGTGEVFAGNYSFVRGDGVFKSTDGGLTWNQLESTAGLIEFQSVNDLMVDPNNADVVVIATNHGIYKTMDGGLTWEQKYASNYSSSRWVQDFGVDPTNFNNQYATVRYQGVLKSTDGGETWFDSSSGMTSVTRIDLAVAPTDPNRIYASTDDTADNITYETIVYISTDAGQSWGRFVEDSDEPYGFLGEQGWYDNIIAVHPFDENKFFVGGVYVGKFDVTGEEYLTDRQFAGVDLENTSSFLSFVNFSAPEWGGALYTGDGDNPSTEFSTVEIRFGPGMEQLAHRFTVPADGGSNGDGGAGVPDSEYAYQDYVTVPFEVWDIENNRQLMVSFRDNQRDGEFNLNPRDDTNDPGLLTAREYLFISNIDYSATPDPDITADGGDHLYQNMYFFWPIAAPDFEWGVDALPDATMRINYGQLALMDGDAKIVSDPRGDFGGKNGNLHADHHNLIMIPIDEATNDFWILNGNDGGLGLSMDGGETWEQILEGYVTTQFYGADKKPKEDMYFGGMQDNGSWISLVDTPGPETHYSEKIGGDGFEVVWHATDPQKVMGSLYNNRIYRSLNGGNSFSPAQTGIISEEGPFITRIASSDKRPETVFAVSDGGVLKTDNFGTQWKKIEIPEGWGLVNEESIPQVTSQHDVKVSIADPDIVWAGAGMFLSDDRKMVVSTDGGESFNVALDYPAATLGYMSGLATHPTEKNTAYVLFSYPNSPKILRTTDLGQTWVDITGYNTNDAESTNGFPDVFVHSLLVMPHQPEVIWAGTEIGIFQSVDNGGSWSYLDVGFPAVSVWSMKVVDDQVVIGTHGRGIWTITIPGLLKTQSKLLASSYLQDWNVNFNIDLPYAYDSVKFYIDGEEMLKIDNPATGVQDISVNLNNPMAVTSVQGYFIAFADGVPYQSATQNISVDLNPFITSFTQNQEPDPLTGLKLSVDVTETYDSLVLFVNDQRLDKIEDVTPGEFNWNITIPGIGEYDAHVVGYYNDGVAFTSNVKTLNVSTITGLFTSALETKPLLLYPNPAVDFMAYELPTGISNAYTVEIIDMRGQVIFQKQMLNALSSNQLNVSSLEKGFYILTLKSENEVFTQRFMKK